LISTQEDVDATTVASPFKTSANVAISSEELISFGTLRKQFRCGPVRMLLKLMNKNDNDNAVMVWKNLPVTSIAEKVLTVHSLISFCSSSLPPVFFVSFRLNPSLLYTRETDIS
jgi:hypothetical protein